MYSRIKDMLSKNEKISDLKLISSYTSSSELFVVKDKLDMVRAKDVEKHELTVYVDFDYMGDSYRGSSTVTLNNEMEKSELKDKIKSAVNEAGLVKNKWYPMVSDEEPKDKKIGEFDKGHDLREIVYDIKEQIYSESVEGAFINSCEIFAEDRDIRITNSKGVDRTHSKLHCRVEVITESVIGDEPVELTTLLESSDFRTNNLSSIIKTKLENTVKRAKANKTQKINNINVFITNASVYKFMMFYYEQSNAKNIYYGTSKARLNEDFMKDSKGDKLSMKLVKKLEGSTHSRPFDLDGVPLEDVVIYENGVLKNVQGNIRFTSYLNLPTTGVLENYVVKPGELSMDELKKEPYFEIHEFSNFQLNKLTGGFGGEIRLAEYFDGKSSVFVYGGSIHGNIFEAQKDFKFTKETQNINSFTGPYGIMIRNMTVMGE